MSSELDLEMFCGPPEDGVSGCSPYNPGGGQTDGRRQVRRPMPEVGGNPAGQGSRVFPEERWANNGFLCPLWPRRQAQRQPLAKETAGAREAAQRNTAANSVRDRIIYTNGQETC